MQDLPTMAGLNQSNQAEMYMIYQIFAAWGHGLVRQIVKVPDPVPPGVLAASMD